MGYSINLENTATWAAAFLKNYQPTMFLRKNIFSGLETFRGDSVIMDYKKGTRKLAPFVAPGNSAMVARTSFTTKEYAPPMMAPARALNVKALKQRAFGENPLNPMSEAERASRVRAEDLKDMTNMIDRRIEWMCAQMLVNGKFTAEGYAEDGKEKITDTVTLDGFTQKKTLSSGDLWSSDTADIYNQIKDIGVEMRKNGNNPTMMIANSKTITYLLNNKSLHEKMLVPHDALFATMKPEIMDKTVTRYAILTPGNIEVYGYDDCYEDDAGQIQSYIPDGYVIFTSKDIGKILAAAVTQLMEDNEFHTFEGLYVPKEWCNPGSDTRYIRQASASVPMVNDVDSWYTLKVL